MNNLKTALWGLMTGPNVRCLKNERKIKSWESWHQSLSSPFVGEKKVW